MSNGNTEEDNNPRIHRDHPVTIERQTAPTKRRKMNSPQKYMMDRHKHPILIIMS